MTVAAAPIIPPSPSATPGALPTVSSDPLPSWNEGASKRAILAFVARITQPNGPDFVPPGERIATFDDDGTLWPEQPMYTELAFLLDRVGELAPAHPEWKRKEPFKSVLAGDVKAVLSRGEAGVFELIAATHTGMTTTDFEQAIKRWFSKAKHPSYGRLYTDCVYQPMLEVLALLRDNGFKTFIVSGGGVEFMRAVAEELYAIPPERVVGSSGKLRFELREGKPVIVHESGVIFTEDKEDKPVGIQRHVGRRPLAAFGNSDGDQHMLEWTAAGPGARLVVLVHHTDAEREAAYDRTSPIGKLDRALDEARAKAWTVVSMKDDWKTIFPAPSPVPPAPPATKPPAPTPVGSERGGGDPGVRLVRGE